MVGAIIEYCAKHRFIVLLVTLGVALAGLWAFKASPKDALPDLSDTQVIIYTEWPGRSPDLVEDQITYPIVTRMLSAPNATVVRGVSDFGFSYVYVLFKEGTDIYWARSRVLEYLSQITGRLPKGAAPVLGPDATGVGWVYQYALVDESGKHDLASLRTLQDWYIRYQLAAVEGVAEVAGIGGFTRQYQINVDPNKLAAYRLGIEEIMERVKDSNNDVGGRVIEFRGTEFVVRGRGYIKSVADIEQIAIAVNERGVPVLLRDVAHVGLGPDMRRGVADLDGKGDTVGGIVVMRFGENAQAVIERIKAKIAEIEPTLPHGVKFVTTYDRADLIDRAVRTISENLVEELVIISVLIVVFLFHFRSAMIPLISLPVAVVVAFIPLYWMGISVNVMSLGGIIVAIGDMVDAAIIMVDNAHKRLEEWEAKGRPGDRTQVLIDSAKEVGPAIFASLLVISIAFMPVFTLEAQEGRLFKPLAFTKNFAIAASAVLAITLIPALMTWFIRGRIRPEHRNPINRVLAWLYRPVLAWALRWRKSVVALALALMAAAAPAYLAMGSEFMPPLNEGVVFYMPVGLPGLSVTEAQRLIQVQDQVLKSFPEVQSVFGKAGRADTATDPAGFNMIETVAVLKPPEQWRRVPVERPWLPQWARPLADRVLGATRSRTFDELTEEMDAAMRFPGITNAWTMPIKARIDMLTTGIRTPVGIKVLGSDLTQIDEIGRQIERALGPVPGTRSVFAERAVGGYFLDFEVRRDRIARYGLTVGDVSRVIESAIGGESFATTIEGRERYPISVRYPRELRDDLERVRRVLVMTPAGAQVPLEQLADIRLASGPPVVRDEDGQLASYVFVDVVGRDIGSYVADAKDAVAREVKLGTGYRLAWSGQYEFMERIKARLKIFVPLTLAIIFVLFYFTFGSVTETLILMLSIPFSLVGAVWFMSPLTGLGYNLSIAVWVGVIALAGVAAETGAVMLAYLDEAYRRRVAAGRLNGLGDLIETIHLGATERARPMTMAALANILGLLPVMFASGTGADVMKRISAPMVGGMVSAMLLTMLIVPVIYSFWRAFQHRKAWKAAASE